MNTYIINSIQDFNQYFHIFKKSARCVSSNDIFIVGFDIEFICKANYPESFSKSYLWNINTTHETSVCTIQIASESMCLVINLVKMGLPMPNNLIKLLTKTSWIKVGVGVDLDLTYLSNNFNLGHCGGAIDIKNLALLAKYKNPSLEFLFNQLVGSHNKKTATVINNCCDWSRELNNEQLLYAARDAIMSIKVFNEMIKPSIDNLIKIEQETNTDNVLKINFANAHFDNLLSESVNDTINYVGLLNEIAQKERKEYPSYKEYVLGIKTFKITCHFCNKITEGIANSKKDAKQIAAEKMYYSISPVSN